MAGTISPTFQLGGRSGWSSQRRFGLRCHPCGPCFFKILSQTVSFLFEKLCFLAPLACILRDILKEYNVTILAYGQTGSGKTFSMGTADTTSTSNSVISQNSGIIQRAVKDLFLKIDQDSNITFEINVSFLEVFKSYFSLNMLTKFCLLALHGKSV